MPGVAQPGQKLLVREGEEVWEITVPGTVWVEVTNDRGKSVPLRVGGRPGARLRISAEDRELTQERIVDRELDPFVNGMLVRVDADQQQVEKTRSDDALTTEDLLKIFATQGKKFQTTVDGLGEVTVRRMWEMAEDVDATASQINYLKDSIERRWPIGGDTKVYREMQADPS
jgi:hypothetical protein